GKGKGVAAVHAVNHVVGPVGNTGDSGNRLGCHRNSPVEEGSGAVHVCLVEGEVKFAVDDVRRASVRRVAEGDRDGHGAPLVDIRGGHGQAGRVRHGRDRLGHDDVFDVLLPAGRIGGQNRVESDSARVVVVV